MKKFAWLVPAAASVAFLAFTLRIVAKEGLFGFIPEHAVSGWGMQIGIDLVSACTIALFFGAPLARKYGVRFWPWVVLTLLTGSIGLFAFAARILYARAAAHAASEPASAPRMGTAGAA